MARINWKKKYQDELHLRSRAETREENLRNEIIFRKRQISALKGQLTKERKKNAEARELMELLEWAKKNRFEIEIDFDGFSKVFDDDLTVGNKNLLLALRIAKKEVEGAK